MMNMLPIRRLLLALCVCLLATQALFAEGVRPVELNPALDSLFTAGQFAKVEVQALRQLMPSSGATENERTGAYLYLGFVATLDGRADEAEDAFAEALRIQPGLSLDPVYVPPGLLMSFNRVRVTLDAKDNSPRNDKKISFARSEHYVLGTISNLVVPGTGFMISNRGNRGTLWMMLQLASAGMCAYAYQKMDSAEEDYLKASNPGVIASRYDKYNYWHKHTWIFGTAAAAIYLGAQLDYQVGSVSMRVSPTVIKGSTPSTTTPGILLSFHR